MFDGFIRTQIKAQETTINLVQVVAIIQFTKMYSLFLQAFPKKHGE